MGPGCGCIKSPFAAQHEIHHGAGLSPEQGSRQRVPFSVTLTGSANAVDRLLSGWQEEVARRTVVRYLSLCRIDRYVVQAELGSAGTCFAIGIRSGVEVGLVSGAQT